MIFFFYSRQWSAASNAVCFNVAASTCIFDVQYFQCSMNFSAHNSIVSQGPSAYKIPLDSLFPESTEQYTRWYQEWFWRDRISRMNFLSWFWGFWNWLCYVNRCKGPEDCIPGGRQRSRLRSDLLTAMCRTPPACANQHLEVART